MKVTLDDLKKVSKEIGDKKVGMDTFVKTLGNVKSESKQK
jgi:hypothetical protein